MTKEIKVLVAGMHGMLWSVNVASELNRIFERNKHLSRVIAVSTAVHGTGAFSEEKVGVSQIVVPMVTPTQLNYIRHSPDLSGVAEEWENFSISLEKTTSESFPLMSRKNFHCPPRLM